MPIEVTSVPERGWFSHKGNQRARLSCPQLTKKAIAFRVFVLFLVFATVAAGDALLRSYKFYAQLIEARLATGYLTSRPGLYAAPRTLQVGQHYSMPDLIEVLRRAGYVEKNGSDVWSGTFTTSTSAVDVRPTYNGATPRVVHITFGPGDVVASISIDELPLDAFTLEPEILTNDLSSKTGRRRSIGFSDIPPVLVNAILAIEDRRFFEHSGIDAFGVLRALVHNTAENDLRQGGSTITQQLVKNTYLSSEHTLNRKYAEAMLALALERRLSKQDIFALYCNEVYLGQRGSVGARGVEQAAHLYFEKELSKLTIAEAATLAGMIKGPGRYSPEQHPAEARARRNTVLSAMADAGFISPEQSHAAMSQPLALAARQKGEGAVAPYFIDYVNRVAENQLDVSGGTSRLYTTIDLDLQRLAENALKKQLGRLDSTYPRFDRQPQAALVALDPHTGNVLAMVGGREYGESQLNRATDAYRQPGSTFKPFVYASALEMGMSPVQMFSDTPREFVYDGSRIYRPANYGGGYSMREVTMRTALVKSLNVVTVDVAMQAGLSRIARLAESLGLPRPQRYPATALGTGEVTPLQLAAAYASFVNGGKKITPRVVTSVAQPPANHSLIDEPQVMKPTTAYMITNTLSAVVDHGTARAARNAIKGTAIAGKTGTSRDGWFVGYTPNLVCVVWIGFDDNSQLGLTGGEAALPAWIDFMGEAVNLRPELGGGNFECPEGIKFVEIDTDTGLISTLTCPRRELIAVTDSTAPNLECPVHGNLRQLPEVTPAVNAEETTEVARIESHDRPGVAAKTLRTTRVDVDAQGRRVLVNDPLAR